MKWTWENEIKQKERKKEERKTSAYNWEKRLISKSVHSLNDIETSHEDSNERDEQACDASAWGSWCVVHTTGRHTVDDERRQGKNLFKESTNRNKPMIIKFQSSENGVHAEVNRSWIS